MWRIHGRGLESDKMNQEKFIICINNGGLGNRLKGLISVIRLSKKLGRKLILYWPNTQHCGCRFKDLFENSFPEINEEELKAIKKEGNYRLYRDILDSKDDAEKYLLFKTWKFVLLPNEIPENFAKVFSSESGKNFDFEYDRIPEALRQELLIYINELRPKDQMFIDDFAEKHSLKDCVGIHIRKGDYRFTVDRRDKISTDEKFIRRMKEMPKSKFFLCTDSKETENKFKEIFGEQIITFPKGDRKRSKTISIQEALVDQLLLSKTKHILGSYLSTFTELAWWFGGCKAKVEIIGETDTKENLRPKTLFQKIIRKINFYKVTFLRKVFRVY